MGEDQHDIQRLLEETVAGASVSWIGILFKQVAATVFAWMITGGAGATTYGIVAALKRIEQFYRFSISGLHTTVYRTLPRYSTATQNILMLGLYGAGIIVTATVATTIVLFDETVISLTVLRPQDRPALYFFSAALVTMNIVFGSSNIFKALRKIKLSNIVERFVLPSTKVIGVFLVLALVGTSPNVIWGVITASTAVAAAISIFLIFHYTDLSLRTLAIDDGILQDVRGYLPSAMTASMAVSLQLGSFYILMAIMLPAVEAGAFSIALLVSNFIKWPLSSVNQIFPPIATELYSNDATDTLRSMYKTTSKLILMAIIPLTAVIVTFPGPILGMFAPTYARFTLTLQLMAVAVMFASMVGSVGLLLLMTDNEHISARIQIILATISVAVSVALVTRYGITGLAVGYLFAFTANNGIELAVLYRREQLQPFTFDHLQLLIAGTLLATFLMVTRTFGHTVPQIMLVLTACCAFYIYSYRTILHDDERGLIQSLRR